MTNIPYRGEHLAYIESTCRRLKHFFQFHPRKLTHSSNLQMECPLEEASFRFESIIFQVPAVELSGVLWGISVYTLGIVAFQLIGFLIVQS